MHLHFFVQTFFFPEEQQDGVCEAVTHEHFLHPFIHYTLRDAVPHRAQI